ncbi:ABC transporter substrate-binding protein [Bosea caraganae]|uniref:ABC transporter substrate-binding protein n=1 Tax=Bosea caraganae TaxID=2763117 RepID=A0A370L9W7_9HYPH|nr:ABC transporter substrate-binding protein [Bosea caraganae]RDJ21845.1 ABC transporter substrate-binding protein [Bosea caraganae]RDJ28124.1 ABC transporter substrate-binding protein [Bosea caraganae]
MEFAKLGIRPMRHGRMLAAALALQVGLLAPGLAQAFGEAPPLKQLVDAGKLPPVDQRLPKTPQVITPYERVGQYGGVIRQAMRGDGDYNAILRAVGAQGLTRWDIKFTEIVPNVAEGWTTNADKSEYTFKLRPGMKWSDGQPFTADDILFFVQDLLPDKAFFQSPPPRYVVNGKLMTGEKIDDNTVKLTFGGPYRTFPEEMAAPVGQHPVLYAKHYCKQFHPKYATNLDELMKQNNVKDWAALMRLKCGDIEVPSRWANLERPTLDPWVVKEPYKGGATRIVLERNPYFWQVDTAGNQLPYTDALQFTVFGDVETILLAAINGQLDLQIRYLNAISNKPVLSENMAKGAYTIMEMKDLNASSAGLMVNQTSPNPALRTLIRTPGFTKALSLGMDRSEINEIVFLGGGTPRQIGPLESHRLYNKQLATQFIEHDVKQANAILDGLGLTKKDGQGFRLYPQGGRISLAAIVSIGSPAYIEVLELIRKQWAEIGVELLIRSSERSLFYDRAQNNDYDLSVDAITGGLDPTQEVRSVLVVHPLDSRQSIPWVKWYTSGGKVGEEPSESMKQRLALFDKWKVEPDEAKADDIYRQILQLAADAFEVIGVAQPPAQLGIRKNNLRNVFDTMPYGWTYATPGGSLPQQYFYAR